MAIQKSQQSRWQLPESGLTILHIMASRCVARFVTLSIELSVYSVRLARRKRSMSGQSPDKGDPVTPCLFAQCHLSTAATARYLVSQTVKGMPKSSLLFIGESEEPDKRRSPTSFTEVDSEVFLSLFPSRSRTGRRLQSIKGRPWSRIGFEGERMTLMEKP
jgi:hypothetical protein